MTPATLHRRAVLAGLAGCATIAATGSATATADDPLTAIAAEADALEQLRAIVVVKDGEERLARAFRGPDLDRPVNVKSVSKSIVALMTGIAIDRGLIGSVDATLGELIPGLIPGDADPRVQTITVEDLLTMRAGLERTSGPNYGAWVASPNWVRYALSRPFVSEPGGRFQYSTGSYHVLGVVLATVANRSLLTLAREWLGTPLGIEIAPWTRDPQGHYMGGNNMALSPRDLARIGEMVRLGGKSGDTQVVPAAWIEASLEPRTRSPFSGDQYGYGWFIAAFGGVPAAYARGYGGQMIYVLKDAGLTVAVTSDPTLPARTDGHAGDLHDLVGSTIVPVAAEI
ncbi:serine hydrolase [Acuticoccus sp. MNP-M23]|uniref:serine hydrolase domain-containing protein n=1 Tax=Acuticoccus sp. MNP-M23 TaxID=3072793 RepID=UPI002814EC61|nr:serine hydrolase [Acuticoccus sp. MNP-M23]WMS41965.1 serine hydrolase [Acuticoccus sp. MNP-M23]